MATPFPRVRSRSPGYNVREVDEFLDLARRSFDAAGGRGAADVTAADIRHTAFSMERGGYATGAVDTALERLEDAFAGREREQAMRAAGEKSWYAATRTLAKEIIGRVNRPERERFARVGLFALGYAPREVDRFADRVREYFEEGSDLSVDEVRAVAFRAARRGYREAQVDLLIDGVVEVMLAVR